MSIGPNQSLTEDLPPGTIRLYGVTWLLGKARSKVWWHKAMLKQSSKL